MSGVSMDYIKYFQKLYIRITAVLAWLQPLTPSCLCYLVNKYIEAMLGYPTTNINEIDH